MCASVKCYIRACLLESRISHQREETAIDGRPCGRHQFVGMAYKDNGWEESSKRVRCVPQVEGQRLEEESKMAAPQGFVTRGGILKTIVVQMQVIYHIACSLRIS